MGSETRETPGSKSGFVVRVKDCNLQWNGFLLALAAEESNPYLSGG